MDIAVEVACRAGKVVQEASIKSTPIYLVAEFIGEESSTAGEKCILTDSPSWNIDPIDGTCNFVYSFYMVAVSIGFAKHIYHCFDGMLYTARKGQRGILHWSTGAAEAYYRYGLHCWDIAATVVIREAGGVVIGTTGGVVAAGTHNMASYIVQQLQPIGYEWDDSDPGLQK
uniref:Inositol monophosphatase 2 n=1 Tax=Oncorhynchus mykiss TaxID=8022 RepID=A0A8C7NUS3_ONCMY